MLGFSGTFLWNLFSISLRIQIKSTGPTILKSVRTNPLRERKLVKVVMNNRSKAPTKPWFLHFLFRCRCPSQLRMNSISGLSRQLFKWKATLTIPRFSLSPKPQSSFQHSFHTTILYPAIQLPSIQHAFHLIKPGLDSTQRWCQDHYPVALPQAQARRIGRYSLNGDWDARPYPTRHWRLHWRLAKWYRHWEIDFGPIASTKAVTKGEASGPWLRYCTWFMWEDGYCSYVFTCF